MILEEKPLEQRISPLRVFVRIIKQSKLNKNTVKEIVIIQERLKSISVSKEKTF
jgi:hypothetical protein